MTNMQLIALSEVRSINSYVCMLCPQGANTLIMNLLTSFADDKVAAPQRTLDGTKYAACVLVNQLVLSFLFLYMIVCE